MLVAPALAAPGVGPSKADITIRAPREEEKEEASDLEARDPQNKRRRRPRRGLARKANRKATRRDSDAAAVDRRDVSEHSTGNEDPEIGIRELADDSEASEVAARSTEELDAADVEARGFTALHHDEGVHAEEAVAAAAVEARDFSALHHDGGAHGEEADASEIEAREFAALHHGEEVDAADIEAREIFAFDHDESETIEE